MALTCEVRQASVPELFTRRLLQARGDEETRRVRAGGRGGDEDMYVRNADEVSERGPEAGIRRQRRLQLDHMVCSYSPHIFHHSRPI